MQTLQTRQKWIKPQRNLKIGNIVLVRDDDLPRNQWKLARVDETLPSDDGCIRKVTVAIGTYLLDSRGRRTHEVPRLKRPIHKLVLIVPKTTNSPSRSLRSQWISIEEIKTLRTLRICHVLFVIGPD